MTTAKENYFTFLHIFITAVMIADVRYKLYTNFSRTDTIAFNIFVVGLIGGGIISFVWEYGVEEQIMKRPASRKDIITMTVTGTVTGLILSFVTIPPLVLLALSIISVGFVGTEIVAWWYNRKKVTN